MYDFRLLNISDAQSFCFLTHTDIVVGVHLCYIIKWILIKSVVSEVCVTGRGKNYIPQYLWDVITWYMPLAQYSSNGSCPSRPLLVSLTTTCLSLISGPVIAFLVGLTATDKTEWGDGRQMPSAKEVVTFPVNVCWILRGTAFLLNRTLSTTWKHVMLLVVGNVLFVVSFMKQGATDMIRWQITATVGSPLLNAKLHLLNHA